MQIAKAVSVECPECKGVKWIPYSSVELQAQKIITPWLSTRPAKECPQCKGTGTLWGVVMVEDDPDVTLGVGDGSGRLFVHGDYESIKACQAALLRKPGHS